MTFVNVSLWLEGKRLQLPKISQLTIESSYNTHHQFTIYIPLSDASPLDYPDVEQLMGEYIDIRFQLAGGSNKGGRFLGVVDELKPSFSEDGKAHLIINGYSPSHIMDTSSAFDCFGNCTLTDLAEKAVKPYRKKYFPPVDIERCSEKVEWSIQAESCYQYLCRIAELYGKVFYYDGNQFFFGKLRAPDQKPIPLEMGKQLHNLEFSLNLAPADLVVKGWDSCSGKELQVESDKLVTNNRILKSIIDKSRKCYPRAEVYARHSIAEGNELKRLANRLLARQVHELFTVEGVSSDPSLRIGSEVILGHNHNFLRNDVKNRHFLIIYVHHQISAENTYQNSFLAIPAGLPYPVPMLADHSRISGTLRAIVRDIADPDGLGRVKVELIGARAKPAPLSPWLRVLASSVAEYGFQSIPQPCEQVLLFFEDIFNPDQSPYVLGSIRNQAFPAGTTPENTGIFTKEAGLWINRKTGTLKLWGRQVEILGDKLIMDGEEGTWIACDMGKRPKLQPKAL
ncbi:MAG: hypothetical protein KDD02_15045 [Phaeodactylibacter sp.]|nr:hypothetical protein [Phaeodactylibacter sp.]MCB9302589.1 hypothetical protein [Lewinellaceae bacterium]